MLKFFSRIFSALKKFIFLSGPAFTPTPPLRSLLKKNFLAASLIQCDNYVVLFRLLCPITIPNVFHQCAGPVLPTEPCHWAESVKHKYLGAYCMSEKSYFSYTRYTKLDKTSCTFWLQKKDGLLFDKLHLLCGTKYT